MNINEIRNLSRDEMVTRRNELRDESFRLRIQQQSGHLEKPSELRGIRRESARIATVLTEKTKPATTVAK